MCQTSRMRKVAFYPTIAWSKESKDVERRPGRWCNRDCVAGLLALMGFLGRGDRVVLAFSLPSIHRAHADHQAFHRNVYISHPPPSRTAQPFPPASPPLFVSRQDHASEGLVPAPPPGTFWVPIGRVYNCPVSIFIVSSCCLPFPIPLNAFPRSCQRLSGFLYLSSFSPAMSPLRSLLSRDPTRMPEVVFPP
jgi:hypothetical protein